MKNRKSLLFIILGALVIFIIIMKNVLSDYNPKEIANFGVDYNNRIGTDELTSGYPCINVTSLNKNDAGVEMIIGAPTYEQIENYINTSNLEFKLLGSYENNKDYKINVEKIEDGENEAKVTFEVDNPALVCWIKLLNFKTQNGNDVVFKVE